MYVVISRTESRGGFEEEGDGGGDRRLTDKFPIQQKRASQLLRSTRASYRTLTFSEYTRTFSLDPSCSMLSAYRYPHSTCHLSCLAPVLDLANPGRPFPRAAHYRCHSHCHFHHGSVPATVEAFVHLLEAALEVGEDHLGNCRQKRRRCFRGASLRRVHRMSRRIEAKRDELAVAAAAAAAAVAAAEGEDSKDLDPVAGKELIDKKSQTMQVKQGQGQLGLDTHMPHRSHGDQLRPEDDPGRDERSTLLEVQVGEEQAGKTRPNGDV